MGCMAHLFKRVVKPRSIRRIVQVPLNGNEDLLKRIIATFGPVAIVMHVEPSFMSYGAGIYSFSDCPKEPTSVNHAMVVCGYGEDPVYGDFWWIRNSWSKVRALQFQPVLLCNRLLTGMGLRRLRKSSTRRQYVWNRRDRSNVCYNLKWMKPSFTPC